MLKLRRKGVSCVARVEHDRSGGGKPFALVDDLRNGDTAAMLQFEAYFGSGLRFLIARTFPAEQLDGVVQQCLAAAVTLVRERCVTDASVLPKMVRQAMRDVMAQQERSQSGTSQSEPRSITFADEALHGVTPRDREMLARRYVNGESDVAICGTCRSTPSELAGVTEGARARFRVLQVTRSLAIH